MTRGLIFWILMLVWLVFIILTHTGLFVGTWGLLGSTALIFILFLLLGWQVYGPPVRG